MNEIHDPVTISNSTFQYNNGPNDQITAFNFTSPQSQTTEPSPNSATITVTPPPVLIPYDQNTPEETSEEKRRGSTSDDNENIAPKTITAPSKASSTLTIPKKSRRSNKSNSRYRYNNNTRPNKLLSFPIPSPIGPIEHLPPTTNHHHAATNSNNNVVLPQWYNTTIPLGVKDDRLFLSGLHTYLRSNLVEVFGADEKSVEKNATTTLTSVPLSSSSSSTTTTTTKAKKKGPVNIGQIGIRCRYCHGISSSSSTEDTAVQYPSKISEFYQCVHSLFTNHFPTCPHVPSSVREEVKTLQEEEDNDNLGRTMFMEVYWEDSARMLGMVNVGGAGGGGGYSDDGGVYFGWDPNKGTSLPKLRGLTAAYVAYMAHKDVNTDSEQETVNIEGKGGVLTAGGKAGEGEANEDVGNTGIKESVNTEVDSVVGKEETNEDVGNTDIKEESVNTEVDSVASTTDGKAGEEEANEDAENSEPKQETKTTKGNDNVSRTGGKVGQEKKQRRPILMKMPAIPYIYTGGDTDYSTGNVPIDVTHVVVLDSVTHIDGCAFQNCKFLTSIHISNSVSSIGVRAFEGCSNLASVRLPPGLKCIGHEAFSGCVSLVDLRLPDGLARIEDRAFFRCEGLTTVSTTTVVDCDDVVMGDGTVGSVVGGERCRYLPKDHHLDFTAQVACNVHSIGKGAFAKCTSLRKVTLPSGIGTLGERTFFDCNALKSVHLPASLIGFPVDAFEGCTVLDTIDGLGSPLTEWSKSSSTIHIIPDDDDDDDSEDFYESDEFDDDDTDITPKLRKALNAAGYSTFNLSNLLNSRRNSNLSSSHQSATRYYHTSIWYEWARLASPANGRIPLMTAVAEPCSDWTSVVKIFRKNMPGLYGIDGEVSGLSPFALAASGKEGDLEVSFKLLREYPPAIMMMMMEDNDDNNNTVAVVDDDVEDMDWE